MPGCPADLGPTAARLAECLAGARFLPQLQAILLQGIAFAGFNVVDLGDLYRRTGLPVLLVARRAPDLGAIRRALLTALQLHGRLPEPLRVAHLIAGGVTTGESRHRP